MQRRSQGGEARKTTPLACSPPHPAKKRKRIPEPLATPLGQAGPLSEAKGWGDTAAGPNVGARPAGGRHVGAQVGHEVGVGQRVGPRVQRNLLPLPVQLPPHDALPPGGGLPARPRGWAGAGTTARWAGRVPARLPVTPPAE